MVESRLNVTLGKPRAISRSSGYHWFPHTFLKLRNGSLLLGFSVTADEYGDDMVYANPHVLFESTDGAANWFVKEYVRNAQDPWPNSQLADGTVLAYAGTFMKPSGDLYLRGWTCRDGGPWDGPTDVRIDVPEGLMEAADPQPPGRCMAKLCMNFGVVERENGELLCCAYATFKGDTNSRVVILKSHDLGRGWSFVSTVAHDPDVSQEGFNETAMLGLPDGELLCVMRTGNCSPMHQSRSSDGGQTWSDPLALGTNGVAPNMLVMDSGVIACSYGRIKFPPSEGAAIMFSLDEGRTWTDHTVVYHGPSTGYISMVEVEPGEILFAYDELGYAWDKRDSIMMTRINVEMANG